MPTPKAGPRYDVHADISALAQRVLGHESSLAEFKATTSQAFDSLAKQLSDLGHTMEARMRPQWSVLLTAIGTVMYIFIYFVIQPMQHDLERTTATIVQLQQETIRGFHELRLGTVSREEFTAHGASQVRFEDRMEARLYDIERRVNQPAH